MLFANAIVWCLDANEVTTQVTTILEPSSSTPLFLVYSSITFLVNKERVEANVHCNDCWYAQNVEKSKVLLFGSDPKHTKPGWFLLGGTVLGGTVSTRS